MHHIDRITPRDLKHLLDSQTDICVSMYLPTTPVTQQVDKDRIELKNMRGEVHQMLVDRGVRHDHADEILHPVDALFDDDSFWPYLSDGLAIFLNEKVAEIYRIGRSPRRRVEVSDRFIVRPLLPLFTDDGRYHLIAISENELRTFSGTRAQLSEVPISAAPGNKSQAMALRGRELRKPHAQWQGDEGSKTLYRKYFLQVDRALKPYYGDHAAPLVIAGVDYLVPIFRGACSYRNIAEGSVHGNPEHLRPDELHEKAWPLVAEAMARPRREAIERYGSLTGTGRVSEDISEILGAATTGRVDTLFIDLGQEIHGTWNGETATVSDGGTPGDGVIDLISESAQLALNSGATIYAGEADQVPPGTAVSAIYRY